MDRQTYLRLLRAARRRTRRAGEEDDLLQTALLAAVEAQRVDMTLGENGRWLSGVLRNHALREARSAIRRRQRDTGYAAAAVQDTETPAEWRGFVATLPPALRTTALLVVSGHTKAEIAWLLDLSETAFRKRISEIRQRWRRSGLGALPDDGALQGELAFGLLRQALIRRVRSDGAALGTHDPDGHLIVVSSHFDRARRQRGVSS